MGETMRNRCCRDQTRPQATTVTVTCVTPQEIFSRPVSQFLKVRSCKPDKHVTGSFDRAKQSPLSICFRPFLIGSRTVFFDVHSPSSLVCQTFLLVLVLPSFLFRFFVIFWCPNPCPEHLHQEFRRAFPSSGCLIVI